MVEAYRLGLTGWPLKHSLSPALHQAALASLGLEGDYRCFPVEPLPEGVEPMRDLLGRMRTGELKGLNVTVPHKESVINYLDRLTTTAERIGAVNTIFMDGYNLVGDNTDRDGFLADLDFTRAPAIGHALVLGAGGAARAVVDGLYGRGWKVWVAARRFRQAQEVAESLNRPRKPAIIPLKLEPRTLTEVIEKVTLIVNATPLGMKPHSDTTPWPEGVGFPEHALVYDLVYMPQETRLTRAARVAGLPAVTGLGMLVEQAALAFERWTGNPAPRHAMRLAAERWGGIETCQ